MEKYFPIIKACPLFGSIGEDEFVVLLRCLSADKRSYQKGEYVFTDGGRAQSVGIVLSGGVNVIKEDFWGGRMILAHAAPSELFGEGFTCARLEHVPVSVVASGPTEVLFIDYRRIITTCTSVCAFHVTLIKNMLKILADKNIMLTEKMEILTRRTTREKLLAYLSAQARRANSSIFTIPFSRQELADYLSVDRSAMSNELSKLKADGVIDFDRNSFKIRNGPQ